MTKKWNTVGERQYTFSVEGKDVGSMKIDLNTLATIATAKIGDKDYTIKRTGFWKSSIVITNNNHQSILKVYSEKWFSKAYTIEYNGRKYKLLMRNNPLAEWVILQNSQEVLAYGINADKNITDVRIISTKNSSDYLFDFLLWYLFVPVVTEDGAIDIVSLVD